MARAAGCPQGPMWPCCITEGQGKLNRDETPEIPQNRAGMHRTGIARRGVGSVLLHPTGPSCHHSPDPLEPWRYSPHAPGCCCLKQGVITVTW